MGRQSSRILINGQDAKQVISCDTTGIAYDIDQIWMCDKEKVLSLAWEKLQKTISFIIEYISGIEVGEFLAFGNDMFLSYYGGTFYKTIDGKGFELLSAKIGNANVYLNSLIFGNNFFVGAGRLSDNSKEGYFYSDDGENWNVISDVYVDGVLLSSYPTQIQYVNGKYFIEYYSTTDYFTYLCMGTSLSNFTKVFSLENMSYYGSIAYAFGYYWFPAWYDGGYKLVKTDFNTVDYFELTDAYKISVVNDVLFIHGYNNGVITYSTDGINFNKFYANIYGLNETSGSGRITDILYFNDVYVIVNHSGSFLYFYTLEDLNNIESGKLETTYAVSNRNYSTMEQGNEIILKLAYNNTVIRGEK